MIKIIYPIKKPAVKIVDGKELIFCAIRKKWLLITPEEWVRQNFLLYLIEVLKYPASLIAVEKLIKTAEVNKRFDIVVYKQSVPFIIIECKEMNVPLSANTLRQVLQYNTVIDAPFIAVTNGTNCAAFEKINNQFFEIDIFPTH